jgi:predicted nucleic acid-binding protein
MTSGRGRKPVDAALEIPGCVLDASVVARWWLPEDATDRDACAAAIELFGAYTHGKIEVHAPELLLGEVANVFWKAVEFREWPVEAARRAVRDLLDLPIHVHPCTEVLAEATELALLLRVTVYDALYVAVARQTTLPFYTTDRKLIRAVSAAAPEVRALE